jgi:hypothetical protein
MQIPAVSDFQQFDLIAGMRFSKAREVFNVSKSHSTYVSALII